MTTAQRARLVLSLGVLNLVLATIAIGIGGVGLQQRSEGSGPGPVAVVTTPAPGSTSVATPSEGPGTTGGSGQPVGSVVPSPIPPPTGAGSLADSERRSGCDAGPDRQPATGRAADERRRRPTPSTHPAAPHAQADTQTHAEADRVDGAAAGRGQGKAAMPDGGRTSPRAQQDGRSAQAVQGQGHEQREQLQQRDLPVPAPARDRHGVCRQAGAVASPTAGALGSPSRPQGVPAAGATGGFDGALGSPSDEVRAR